MTEVSAEVAQDIVEHPENKAMYIAVSRPSMKGTLFSGQSTEGGKSLSKRFQFQNGVLILEDPIEIEEMDKMITEGLGQHCRKADLAGATKVAKEFDELRLKESSAVAGTFSSEAHAETRHRRIIESLRGSEHNPKDADLLSKMADKLREDSDMMITNQEGKMTQEQIEAEEARIKKEADGNGTLEPANPAQAFSALSGTSK